MISRQQMRLIILLVSTASACLPGCRCGEGEILAELIEFRGNIERDFSDRMNIWETAQNEAKFSLGDGVRAKEESMAILRLSEGSYVRLKAETQIRFLTSISDSSKTGIDVETGEAEITVGGDEFELMTGVGLAVLTSGSRIRIRKTDEGLEFRVDIGTATFQTTGDQGAQTAVLQAGDGIEIAIGGAVIARLTDEPDTAAAVVSAGTPDTDVEEIDTAAQLAEEPTRLEVTLPRTAPAIPIEEGPKWADFGVAAGESFFVHSARPPVVIEMRFGDKCPHGATVRVSRKRARIIGQRSANVSFPNGRTRYSVHCLDQNGVETKKPMARGKVVVMRDAGKARLPRSAPPSFVDADGRLYKITYQNQLPKVTIRWPRAPRSSNYIVHVETRGKGTRDIKARKPSYTFTSGSLREGTHRITYKTSGGTYRQSKATTVQVRFDNATPKASLKDPPEGGFAPGQSVQVAGVAAPGWKVSVAGGNVSMDEHNRFSGQVTHSSKYRTVALRLVHAKRGIHYYLRSGSNRAP